MFMGWRSSSLSRRHICGPNGSGIVVVAEYDNKTCLLAADAFPSKIAAGLKRFRSGVQRCSFDAVKVPHHGSHHNNSNELYQGDWTVPVCL